MGGFPATHSSCYRPSTSFIALRFLMMLLLCLMSAIAPTTFNPIIAYLSGSKSHWSNGTYSWVSHNKLSDSRKTCQCVTNTVSLSPPPPHCHRLSGCPPKSQLLFIPASVPALVLPHGSRSTSYKKGLALLPTMRTGIVKGVRSTFQTGPGHGGHHQTAWKARKETICFLRRSWLTTPAIKH